MSEAGHPCYLAAPPSHRALRHLAAMVLGVVIFGCAAPQENRIRQSEAHRGIGEAYLSRGKFTQALSAFLAAERENPNDPVVHNYLGLIYRAKGRLDRAAFHFERAIALKPDYAEAMNNLGEARLRGKQWDAAIEILKKLDGDLLYTTPHFAHLNLGWAYFKKGDYDRARQYYRRALAYYQDGFEKDFTHVKALRGLGNVYAAMGETAAARETLEEAIAQAPRFAPALFDLAGVYRVQGHKKEAMAALEKVVELTPDSPLGRQASIARRELLSAPKD